MKKRRRKEKSHNALWAAASIAIILIYKMLKSKEQPALASERPPKNISVPKSQEAMSKVGQTKDKALHETEVSCASVVAKIRQCK